MSSNEPHPGLSLSEVEADIRLCEEYLARDRFAMENDAVKSEGAKFTNFLTQ